LRHLGTEHINPIASHPRQEFVMFATLVRKFSAMFAITERPELDAYLAEMVDFVDLEHRLHAVETRHRPFNWHAYGAPGDWRS
jgi:Protein of unknown function (DUF3563)